MLVTTFQPSRIARNLFVFLSVLSYSLSAYSDSSEILKVDFDKSMGIEERGRYNMMLKEGKLSEKYLKFYRDTFNENFSHKVDYAQPVKIPKIIHQIWIGPKPMPELYKRYAATCKALNPDFEYRLWTNKDVDQILNISPQHKRLHKVYKDGNIYNGQKDVLEYMILYKYGGVFMDMDFDCKESLKPLHYQYNFYAGLEPPYRGRKAILSNALVASEKGNSIFLDILDLSESRYHALHKAMNTKVKKAFRLLRYKLGIKGKGLYRDGEKVPPPQIVLMNSLGYILVEGSKKYYENPIIFPATYFNPVRTPERYYLSDDIKYLFGRYKNKGKAFSSVKPETIAIQDFSD